MPTKCSAEVMTRRTWSAAAGSWPRPSGRKGKPILEFAVTSLPAADVYSLGEMLFYMRVESGFLGRLG